MDVDADGFIVDFREIFFKKKTVKILLRTHSLVSLSGFLKRKYFIFRLNKISIIYGEFK